MKPKAVLSAAVNDSVKTHRAESGYIPAILFALMKTKKEKRKHRSEVSFC